MTNWREYTPTSKQIGYLLYNKVVFNSAITRGTASDLIDVHKKGRMSKPSFWVTIEDNAPQNGSGREVTLYFTGGFVNRTVTLRGDRLFGKFVDLAIDDIRTVNVTDEGVDVFVNDYITLKPIHRNRRKRL
jgi:hypothetical protein